MKLNLKYIDRSSRAWCSLCRRDTHWRRRDLIPTADPVGRTAVLLIRFVRWACPWTCRECGLTKSDDD